MSKVTVRFAESAITDLEAISDWYANQGVSDIGDRLIRRIFARSETLADHPAMGRVVPEFGRPLLRELIQPPFRIVYRIEPNFVRIVRVWRSERLPMLPDQGET